MLKKTLLTLLVVLLCVCVSNDAQARRRRHHHKRKHYTGPPPTHPVVLWARTLEQSNDPEQRKVAAFKLSQYSQNIYQEQVVNALVKCMKDQDVQIKVLCTKAMGRAGNQSQVAWVRKVLLDQYKADPTLRNTIVRAFITRGDNTPAVHDTFLDAAKKAKDQEELLVLIGYFELYGNGSDRFVDAMADIYKKNEDVKLKRAIVKALGDRSQGQDTVVEILSQCSDNKDTPLSLNCLAGLQLQAKKDARAWSAVEKTIESSDPDVLMATLDVINALPESRNTHIAARLLTIIEEMDDPELQEKAVLALGACGDQSEEIVKVLTKHLEDHDQDEAVRIASALVLGKQAAAFPESPRQSLAKCATAETTQSLRSACQLGSQELIARAKTLAAQKPVPSPTPKAAAQTAPSPSASPKAAVQATPSPSESPNAAAAASPSPSATPKVSAETAPVRDEASSGDSDQDEVKAKN